MVYDKVKQLCDQKKVSICKVEKDLGFSSGSIIKWKKSIPSADKLQKVAVYFNVCIEHLLEAKYGVSDKI